MNKNINLIKQCHLLTEIDLHQLDEYFKSGHMFTANYCKNKMIHIEGDPCEYLEIIIQGNVVVERIDENGNLLTVADFVVNDSIGANLLFSSHPFFPLTITCKSPTVVLYMTKALIFDLCVDSKVFLRDYLRIISDHTLVLGNKIKHHVSRTIREGIITYLKRQYLLQNTYTIKMTCTKKSLAEQMGISRTSLSRELQKMKIEGLIDVSNKSITIKIPDILN